MVKVTSARATYLAKAMVTRRIRPMTIDGKKMYQIGLPIHQGFRGIQEDAGRVPRSIANSAFAHGDRSERVYSRVQGLPGEAGESVDRHGQRTTPNQSHLGTRRNRSRQEHLARLRRLQADRRHHLHRLQSLRSGVSGMERLSVPRNRFRQHLPDHAGHGVELL